MTELKTLKDISLDGHVVLMHDINKLAIKWIKEDLKNFGRIVPVGRWIKRLDITEEMLK